MQKTFKALLNLILTQLSIGMGDRYNRQNGDRGDKKMYEVDREKVLKFLFDRAMTTKELSRRAGVSIQAVKNAIAGKRLQIPSVAKIAAAMEIEPNELIVGGEI